MRKFIKDDFNIIIEQKIIDDLMVGTVYVLLFMPNFAFDLVKKSGKYSLGVLAIIISALVIAARISSRFKLISNEELSKQFPDATKSSEDTEKDNKNNNS